ncbi:hypothetical protein [Ekhidna sp.]|uniref:hypothetical protein n=1 Tax=Ekhidna sp. TaxID=2608089 RepID=UPI003CCC1263
MKTLFTPILLGLTLSMAAQTVRVVDNNSNAPTGNNVYSTLQAAADAATAGDFIYVQPSPTTYGNVVVEKELHLVGIGFNLTKDLPHLSSIGNITLRSNSDNTENASNSTITGLELSNIYLARNTNGGPIFNLDGVSIYNNTFTSISWTTSSSNTITVSNMEVYNNRINSGINFQRDVDGVIIRNNLLYGAITFSSTNENNAFIQNNVILSGIRKDSQGDVLIIQNNNFIGQKNTNNSFSSIMIDAIISNNIFYGRTPSIVAAGGSSSTNFQRNVFDNNLTFETGNDELPPAGGGAGNSGNASNLEGISPDFNGTIPVLSSWSSSYDFSLDPLSAAADAGSDGTDIGITGGPYPLSTNFSLSTTSLPTIESFNVSTVINPDDDLDISVQAKSN